jgi:beta-galactosidase/beta-glucuronidase
VNGKEVKRHENGYTSFSVDISSGANFGAQENVMAVFADAAPGAGYWYEGGGLTRHQYLVHTAALHMPPDSTWVHANMSASKVTANGAMPGAGLAATSVLMTVAGRVTNAAATAASDVWLTASFSSADGSLGSASVGPVTIAAGADHEFEIKATPDQAVQLWSVARPFLYTATVEVRVGGKDATAVDSDNITLGARHVRLDPNEGLFLNGPGRPGAVKRPWRFPQQLAFGWCFCFGARRALNRLNWRLPARAGKHTKMRGFCDHSSFGVTGGAVPDRVMLFRGQALRAAGGNSWRMAHNPPAPTRLDVTDRLGILALDENHFYDHVPGYGVYNPESANDSLRDMADLVTRDRSHASVWAWNFCNEVNCDTDPVAAMGMKNVTTTFDGTRAVTMNHIVDGVALQTLDIQGMSHRGGAHMDSFHKQYPRKPLFSSEAIICFNERGVDLGLGRIVALYHRSFTSYLIH